MIETHEVNGLRGSGNGEGGIKGGEVLRWFGLRVQVCSGTSVKEISTRAAAA